MIIYGMNKTTLLDYPGRVAATIFTGACNFRCPFCHNAGLVLPPSTQEIISEEEVFSFLEKRKNILKGLCITGGEPTLQKDLREFIIKVRELGYDIKLDTNGYRPKILQSLLQEGLLDYVAMDIKNCPKKYALTAGMNENGNIQDTFQIENINKSIALLKNSGIEYEFRTTVVKEFHTKEDLIEIAKWIAGCPRYFLQQYQENENIIALNQHNEKSGEDIFHGYEREVLEEILKALQDVPGMTGNIELRGIE